MEGDCLILIDHLKRRGNLSFDLMVAWNKLIQTLSQFYRWDVNFCRREVNAVGVCVCGCCSRLLCWESVDVVLLAGCCSCVGLSFGSCWVSFGSPLLFIVHWYLVCFRLYFGGNELSKFIFLLPIIKLSTCDVTDNVISYVLNLRRN